MLVAGLAGAHKASDSYLQIAAAPGQLDVRWDIALRDLDTAVDLDADADGQLTWGEVRGAWPAIHAYAAAPRGDRRLPASRRPPRHSSDAPTAPTPCSTTAACAWSPAARVRYTLFDDVDPTHRGLLSVRDASGAASGAPRLLDPRRPEAVDAAAAAGSAASGTSASVGRSAADAHAGGEVGFVPPEGVRRIVTGYDHVLFLMCLLLPAVLRRTPAGWRPVDRFGDALWPVMRIVTAFTLAHSITLALAALKLASLPAGFIEPAIALTIVAAAVDNFVPPVPRPARAGHLPVRPHPRLRLRRRAGGDGPADRPLRLGAAAVQPRAGAGASW